MQSWIQGETTARIYTLYADEGEVQDLTGALNITLLLTASDGTEIDTTGMVAVSGLPANGQVAFTPAALTLLASQSPLSALFQVTDADSAVGFYPGEGADTWYVYPPRTAYPRYTFLDLRRQVMRWLDAIDDLDQATGIDELVKQQLNEAALARASEYSWPFMKGSYALDVTTDQRRYTLPGNLGRLLFIWSPAERSFCERIPDRHLDSLGIDPTGTEVSGLYMPYELQGPQLVFFEDPPAAQTLTIGYFRTPSKLLNNSDIPDVPYPHSRLLVWDALLDLKSYTTETANAQLWIAKQKEAEHKLYAAYTDGQTIGERPLRIKGSGD
jgi:hypothetical protein